MSQSGVRPQHVDCHQESWVSIPDSLFTSDVHGRTLSYIPTGRGAGAGVGAGAGAGAGAAVRCRRNPVE